MPDSLCPPAAVGTEGLRSKTTHFVRMSSRAGLADLTLNGAVVAPGNAVVPTRHEKESVWLSVVLRRLNLKLLCFGQIPPSGRNDPFFLGFHPYLLKCLNPSWTPREYNPNVKRVGFCVS